MTDNEKLVIESKLDEADVVMLFNGETGEGTIVVGDGLSWDWVMSLPLAILDNLEEIRNARPEGEVVAENTKAEAEGI